MAPAAVAKWPRRRAPRRSASTLSLWRDRSCTGQEQGLFCSYAAMVWGLHLCKECHGRLDAI
jgi:hypothetical protein